MLAGLKLYIALSLLFIIVGIKKKNLPCPIFDFPIFPDTGAKTGDVITEADVRLFPTIVRFDAVYATLFRCSSKRVKSDYPHIHKWLQFIYQLPNVRNTIDIDGLRRSYFLQLFPLNPSGIVPTGPTETDLGLLAPSGKQPEESSIFFYR